MALWKKDKLRVINPPRAGVVGELYTFNVDASRTRKGSLEVKVNDGVPATILVPLSSRQYQVSFLPREAKSYVVQLKFNGKYIAKNTFTVDIREREVTVSGSGLGHVPVNKMTSFTVSAKDVSATITSPSGRLVPHRILERDNSSSEVEYAPHEVGVYLIEIRRGGQYISHCHLTAHAYDISAVIVGSVDDYVVGRSTTFEIDTSKAGEGEVQVTIVRDDEGYQIESPCIVSRQPNCVYRVSFTPSNSYPTYAMIRFNSQTLPKCPVRLDSFDELPGDGNIQTAKESDTTEAVYMNVPACVQRNVTQNASCAFEECDYDGNLQYVLSGCPEYDSSDDEDAIYCSYFEAICDNQADAEVDLGVYHTQDDLHIRAITRSEDYGYAPLPRMESDDPYENFQAYLDLPMLRSVDDAHALQGISALQRCTNEGGKANVYVVRSSLVADVFALYKDDTLPNKKLSVEFVGEPGLDCKGLTRDLFTCFWRDVCNDLFHGEDCVVPSLPLHRARSEGWKFECLGRILSHSVALTGKIPPTLARSMIITLATQSEVDDDCLMEDFLLFVTPRERTLLTEAMTDFSGMTEDDLDRLQNFYSAYGYQGLPRQTEVKEQILTIACEALVEKPASLISKIRQGIPEKHMAAFWRGLSADDIKQILQDQRPTPEKVTGVIVTEKLHMTDDEDKTLYFLKEFVADLDSDRLTDFLVFVTGSVHQPDKIRVSFTKLTGLERRPISHTCFNLLEVPTSYETIKEFRREFLAVLSSPEAFQFSAI